MNASGLEGKVALVTGATGGVGLRVAEQLAEAGATVVINGRTAANAERAMDALRTLSANARLALGDCGDAQSCAQVAREAAGALGRIDILVSAGAQGRVAPRPFAELSADEIVDAYQSRLLPRIFPVHAALPYMREHGGSIVMLTTDAARHPTPGESIVGAVGAGVILLTKALAKEFAAWRLRMNAVAMTLTSDTPSWQRIFADEGNFQSKLFTRLSERFPWGRAPTADEVARVAVFLAGDEAAQITGQTISVNGGLSFGGW